MCILPTVARKRLGSVYVYPPFGVTQRLGKHVLTAKNTRNNRRIFGRVIFFAVHVLSKESPWVCLCTPLSLLGNSSAKTFPLQRNIFGKVHFLCHPLRIKRKYGISSSKNFLLISYYFFPCLLALLSLFIFLLTSSSLITIFFSFLLNDITPRPGFESCYRDLKLPRTSTNKSASRLNTYSVSQYGGPWIEVWFRQ